MTGNTVNDSLAIRGKCKSLAVIISPKNTKINQEITHISFTYLSFFPPGATQPILGVYFTALYRALASSRARLLDHTQRRATVGRNPLNE